MKCTRESAMMTVITMAVGRLYGKCIHDATARLARNRGMPGGQPLLE
jgi:hypothetical protein